MILQDGSFGRAAVPSGASTGAAEAHELRDGDQDVYAGLGVKRAVGNANGELARALSGFDASDQAGADQLMRSIDGTPDLSRIGANAVLAVSMAICRASATAMKQALHERIASLAQVSETAMPMPMVNILSGGLHAGRGMDVQDFLAVPVGAKSFEEAIHQIVKVRSAAASLMAKHGLSTLLADEGGLSPGFETSGQALDLMIASFEAAGFKPGEDMSIAIDVASSSLIGNEGSYLLAREGRTLSAEAMISMLRGWVRDYPVCSIEDGLHEDAWEDWKILTSELGSQVQLVGDDLFTTNLDRVQRGVDSGVANGVLIKLNQNGTLSGTLEVIRRAREAGYAAVISARSGETEDTFIADLAVGTRAGHIKVGSVRCSERLSKYNQLLRLEESTKSPFAGMSAYSSWKRPARA